MKQAPRERQTLCTGCSKVGLKVSAPPQNPSRGHGMAKISSAGEGHYLCLQTQFCEDRCTQFGVIVVTDPQTHAARSPPQTGPITIHCAAKLSVQCNENKHTSTWCVIMWILSDITATSFSLYLKALKLQGTPCIHTTWQMYRYMHMYTNYQLQSLSQRKCYLYTQNKYTTNVHTL